MRLFSLFAKLLAAVAIVVLVLEYYWLESAVALDPSLAVLHTVSLHAAAVLLDGKCFDEALETKIDAASPWSWTVRAWPLLLEDESLPSYRDVGELRPLAVAALRADLTAWAEFLLAISLLHDRGGVFLSTLVRECPPSLPALHRLLQAHRDKCLVPVGATTQPLLLMCWQGAAPRLINTLRRLSQADMERESPASFLMQYLEGDGERAGVVGVPMFDWLPAPFVPVAAPRIEELGEVTRVDGCVDMASVSSGALQRVFRGKYLEAFRPKLTSDEQLLMRAFVEAAVDVCRKLGIEVVAYGGSLIGAARHGGFTSWDDDVDVLLVHKELGNVLRAATDELYIRGIELARSRLVYKLFATKRFMPHLKRRSATGFAWSWPFVDLWSCQIVEADGVLVCRDDGLSLFSVRSLFPLRRMLIGGTSMQVPRSIDAFNNLFYGNTWMQMCVASKYNHQLEIDSPWPDWVDEQAVSIECERLAHFVPLRRRVPIDDPLALRIATDTMHLWAAHSKSFRLSLDGATFYAQDVCGTTAHVSASVPISLDNDTRCDVQVVFSANRTQLVSHTCSDNATNWAVPAPLSVFAAKFVAASCMTGAPGDVVSLPDDVAPQHRVAVCAQACLQRGFGAFASPTPLVPTCACVDAPPQAEAGSGCSLLVYRAVSLERGRDAFDWRPRATRATVSMPLKAWSDAVGCAASESVELPVDTPLEPPLAEQLYGESAASRCAYACASAGTPFAVVYRKRCRCEVAPQWRACNESRVAAVFAVTPPLTPSARFSFQVLAPCVVTPRTLLEPAMMHISFADCIRSCLHNGVARAISTLPRCVCVPQSELANVRMCSALFGGHAVEGALLEVKIQ